MLFKQHLKYGLISSSATTACYSVMTMYNDWHLSVDNHLIVFFATLAGSLAPDLDAHSKPSKIVALFGSIFCLAAIYQREPYPALIFATGFLFIKSFSHRTWTHVYSLPLVLTIIAFKMDLWFLIPVSGGLCVHYAVDTIPFWKLNSWIKPIVLL